MRQTHPLRAMIVERGLRFDRFAEKAGVSKDRLNHILAFRRPAPEWLYERAAEILECSEADLRPTPAEKAAA